MPIAQRVPRKLIMCEFIVKPWDKNPVFGKKIPLSEPAWAVALQVEVVEVRLVPRKMAPERGTGSPGRFIAERPLEILGDKELAARTVARSQLTTDRSQSHIAVIEQPHFDSPIEVVGKYVPPVR